MSCFLIVKQFLLVEVFSSFTFNIIIDFVGLQVPFCYLISIFFHYVFLKLSFFLFSFFWVLENFSILFLPHLLVFKKIYISC